MSQAVKQSGHNLKDYVQGMTALRRWVLIGLGLAVGVALAIDFRGDFWVEHAFLAGLCSGGVLLLATVLLVEEYLTFHERRKWQPVAAFALEDLARVAREVWLNISRMAAPQLEGSVRVPAFRHRIESREGGHQMRENLLAILAQPGGLQSVYDVLSQLAGRTQHLLARWAAPLVGHGPLAERLSEFTEVHRQIVQLVRLLSIELEGLEMPATRQEISDRVLAINAKALKLDHELFAEASAISPLELAIDLG